MRESGLSVALLATLSLACGSSASTPGAADAAGGAGGADGGGADAGPGPVGGSVGTSVALAAFGDALADAYCQRVFQCCGVMDLKEESCRNGIKGQVATQIEQHQPFLDSGKVVFSPEKAAACINRMLAASCASFKGGSPTLNPTDLCLEAFAATVAPGGGCADDFECVAGWCDPASMKCVAKKPDGASCEDDGDCLSENCAPTPMMCVPRALEGLCPS
jgi:hypothetical protein